MSTRPLASPDECPSNNTNDAKIFCSSSPASVVMPFDVDATRGCCSMGNVFKMSSVLKFFLIIYFSDSGL
jgi:hypothetical protein